MRVVLPVIQMLYRLYNTLFFASLRIIPTTESTPALEAHTTTLTPFPLLSSKYVLGMEYKPQSYF